MYIVSEETYDPQRLTSARTNRPKKHSLFIGEKTSTVIFLFLLI